MRVKPPLLRRSFVPPDEAPILRYAVAILSVDLILALIPAFLLSDVVVESRLVVFSVAIMVSAWYGGWKPGLVATAFASIVSAYFSLAGLHSSSDYRKALIHLVLFVFVALLICSFNAALRSAQEGLRRSEINFRSLVTNAPYGICRCDSAGNLLDVNPALISILGYEFATELLGRNLAGFYPDSQQWFTVADNFRLMRPFNGLLAEWSRKQGTLVGVRLSGRSIRGDRDARFYELYAEDVTEQRALEQQLRQSQKMEAVGRLAGGIAHDFNNLLMVISGYCEFLLERAGSDPQLRGPAQEIANAANRATGLTRQLLAFSRKQILTPKVVDLNAIVTENFRMLDRVIGEDVELAMVPGADLGMVKADPGQIEQVIMNLAVNARDSMPHGGKLIIETSNVSLDETYGRLHGAVAPGEYVMLCVSDTGIGMNSETQGRIFEPFFTTKGPKGTGLGLSTVYGIIKQSGGSIWVYSEPGEGTSFKVYLPRVTSTGEAVVIHPPIAAATVQRGNETILLVEDEDNLRNMARLYLESEGYMVLEAPDGAAAIQLASAHPGPIHLLLTDVIMPGMNGRELAKYISPRRPETKVLYMSGYTENAIAHNGTLDAGITLLQKPFTLPVLKATVRKMLDTAPNEATVSAGQAMQTQQTPDREQSSRARRFRIAVPLRYRQIGENDWRAGKTENISRSGMLFRAEQIIPTNVQLEINLVLPAEIAGLSAAEVTCRGEIVRTVDAPEPAMPPALAAKILQYHFQHGTQVPEA